MSVYTLSAISLVILLSACAKDSHSGHTDYQEVREAGRISEELESYYSKKADEYNLSGVDKMSEKASIVDANGSPIKELKDQRPKVDINEVSPEFLEALKEDANE